jgi:hypothetical protein
MGLFADKISTVVASSAYNLAGDESSQPDPVKSAIISSVLADRTDQIGKVLSQSITQGTVVSQKRFLRFMEENHSDYMITGSVNSFTTVQAQDIVAPVSTLLGLNQDQILRIAAAKIDVGEIDYWAEDWVGKNHPDLERDDWFAEFIDASNTIRINLPGQVSVDIAAPSDLLWATAPQTGLELRKLLYVAYTVVEPGETNEEAAESSLDLFVYRMGSGNAVLDALTGSSQVMTEFYPSLPVRLRNRSLRHEDYTAEYAIAKTAYKKLTGQKLDDLLDTVEDNENIDDIDYAFITMGVALNTQNQTAKEYLYKFLAQLKNTQSATKVEYDTFKDRVVAAERSRLEWERYLSRQEQGIGWNFGEEPPEEPQEVATVPPLNTFEMNSPALDNLRQRLSWCFMTESQRVGNCNRFDGDPNRTKAKKGDYFIHVGSPYQFETRYKRVGQGEDGYVERYFWKTVDLPRIFLFHQTGEFTYTQLEIVGFKHENFVYKTEAVEITAQEALEETDETGFIIPLHAPTLTEMGMSKATRMSGSVSHIVFNSYERVRQKWYEKTVFKILLVVVAAALSVIIPGLGGAAASGILGSNVAVGISLGMTTAFSAALAGAIANALAAVVITTLISTGSTAVFGEKIGAVIGTIASFVVMSYGSFNTTTNTFSVDWSQMMRAENILKLADAASDAISRFMAAEVVEMQGDLSDLSADYAQELEDMQDLTQKVLGSTGVELDFSIIQDASLNYGESRDAFLSRTLLTGTDVVKISQNMISDFAEISLRLPKAFV